MATLALCIPAYNAAWSLPNLFASVEKQSIPFDEVLVYDDGSTDNTRQVAEKFGAKVIGGDKNKGCSFGKNQLALNTTCDWLFFLDSDDQLMPVFAKTVRHEIQEQKEVDMILLAYNHVDTTSGKVKSVADYNETLLKSDPVRFMINTRVINSSVIRRDKFLSIGGFDLETSLLYIEDRAFAVKTALNGFRYGYVKEPCFAVNYYPGSMSSAKPKRWLNASLVLWQKTLEKTGHVYQDEICSQLFTEAVWAAKYGEWGLVRKSLAFVKDINPTALPSASKPFQYLFSIWPAGAYFAREWFLRLTNYYGKQKKLG